MRTSRSDTTDLRPRSLNLSLAQDSASSQVWLCICYLSHCRHKIPKGSNLRAELFGSWFEETHTIHNGRDGMVVKIYSSRRSLGTENRQEAGQGSKPQGPPYKDPLPAARPRLQSLHSTALPGEEQALKRLSPWERVHINSKATQALL